MIRQFPDTFTAWKPLSFPDSGCSRDPGVPMSSGDFANSNLVRILRILVVCAEGSFAASSSSKNNRNPLCWRLFIINTNVTYYVTFDNTIQLKKAKKTSSKPARLQKIKSISVDLSRRLKGQSELFFLLRLLQRRRRQPILRNHIRHLPFGQFPCSEILHIFISNLREV